MNKRMFEEITDPRDSVKKIYDFDLIMFIVVSSLMSGIVFFTKMAQYAEANKDKLAEIFDLSSGLPSHDVLNDVVNALDPAEIRDFLMTRFGCLGNDNESLDSKESETLAIDGKTSRGTRNKKSKCRALHVISAYCKPQRVIIGQAKVDKKSNEIKAIPELLKVLDIQSRVITIDAAGCHRKICEEIIQKEGDYVIAVKGNQKELFEDIKSTLANIDPQQTDIYERHEKDHGRVEYRKCTVTSSMKWAEERHSWPGLVSIVHIAATRTINEKTEKCDRYYISSMPANAKLHAEIIRDHWGIENVVHWTLDSILNADKSSVYNENGAECLEIIRHIGFNLINRFKDVVYGKKIRFSHAVVRIASNPLDILKFFQQI